MKVEQYIIVRRTGSKWSPRYSSRLTSKSPALAANEVAVKVSLSLPDAIFDKPAFTAAITVPEEVVSAPQIDAEVLSNVQDIIKQNTGFEVHLLPATEVVDEEV